ncbi:crotonase/enoyl-CoA hydratase family protein [Siculibacillus lacustris]|uniref:Crotonase/enoyl-CoA hydratase family protein n=1 Tax=Siculibacillus lacustris TaxID=1549641 RepID=A0A4Q9VHD1_9HYPH|nr:crotonase/enoyl-CoA hydratase family protein [Siculibacillus lacustris]TBW34507.1 crotonase/enoyl-CoA hydratase family protein [Siculibacillus lacustris]
MTQDRPLVGVTRRGAVAEIRIDRPEKKNALTAPMYAAITAALIAGEADPAVAVHLLCGSPGAFSAGNDVEEFLGFAREGRLGDEVVAFLVALASLDKPLVCAVDGLAVGVGTTLLFHADLVYASDRSVFRTPFLDLGLVPEAASSLLAPRLMGHAAAFELLCLGAPFDARRALAVGLVNRIVAADDLEQFAREAADALAAKPAAALAAARRLLRSGSVTTRAEVLARIDLEAEEFRRRLTSAEAQAAFAAFMARRR